MRHFHILIGEKKSFIIDVKITSYWLLVKKRIYLVQTAKFFFFPPMDFLDFYFKRKLSN